MVGVRAGERVLSWDERPTLAMELRATSCAHVPLIFSLYRIVEHEVLGAMSLIVLSGCSSRHCDGRIVLQKDAP